MLGGTRDVGKRAVPAMGRCGARPSVEVDASGRRGELLGQVGFYVLSIIYDADME